MKILITGTAGFIGFHLASLFIKIGEEVVGLDCINDYYDITIKYDRLRLHGIKVENIAYGKEVKSNLFPNYSFYQVKLEDREQINEVITREKPEVICNLAAQAGVRYSLTNPYAYIESNIVGYLNILESARINEVGHFVYASSSSVYGLNELMPLSTAHNVDHPVSLYAASKKSNELMAHTYSHLYGMPTTGLRFFTVYGPWGRPDMALFIFTKAILENKPISIFHNGDMIRDFTYIDDIVEGIKRVIYKKPQINQNWNGMNPDPSSSSAPYKIYNIGNNDPVNLMDFIHAIEEKLSKKAQKIFLPMQKGDVPKTMADVSDLVLNHGYKPATHYKTGISQFIDWYLSYYGIKSSNK